MTRAFVFSWVGFWLLMMLVAVQDHLRHGEPDVARPLIAEVSSALVATLIAWLHWRLSPHIDRLLAQPLHWLGVVLLVMPVLAVAFVVLVFGLRQLVHAMLGLSWEVRPWLQLLPYEGAKFAVFYLLFCGVMFGVRAFLAWHASSLQAARAQALASQARLLQLSQQLQPHFLFNALNTVSSLVHDAPDRADALLTSLATLLRAATDVAHRPLQTLTDELQLVRAYADIMCARYTPRVHIDWAVADAALACQVPTLSLQPVLENCFRHGVERRPGPVRIEVRADVQDGRLRLQVQDDAGQLGSTLRFGVGLGNLRDRLHALHGPAAAVAVQAVDGGGVRVTVELPCAC